MQKHMMEHSFDLTKDFSLERAKSRGGGIVCGLVRGGDKSKLELCNILNLARDENYEKG